MNVRIRMREVICSDPDEGADELMVLTRIVVKDADDNVLTTQDRGLLIEDFEEEERLSDGDGNDIEISDFSASPEFFITFENARSALFDSDHVGLTQDQIDSIARFDIRMVGLELDGFGSTSGHAAKAFRIWHNEGSAFEGAGDSHDILWDFDWVMHVPWIRTAVDSGDLPNDALLTSHGQSTRRYSLDGDPSNRVLIDTTHVEEVDCHEYDYVLAWELKE